MSDERLRPNPESRFEPSAHLFDLPAELAALRSEGPAKHGHRQKTLLKLGGRTIALFSLDAGAGLPDHQTAGTVTIQPVEGEIVVTIDGRSHTLGPHQVQVLAPNVRHAVRAERPAAFVLQVSLAQA